MTNREAGLNVIKEMMGPEAADQLGSSANSKAFGAPVAAYALDQVFGDIWNRPGLDKRSRSLVTIAIMIAQRQPHEFGLQMAAGLSNGLSLEEIQEIVVQALPYVGYPAVSTALRAAQEVIKERGLDNAQEYAGHRGLL